MNENTVLELLQQADPARGRPPTEPGAVDRALAAVRLRGAAVAAAPRGQVARVRVALVGVAVVAVVGLVIGVGVHSRTGGQLSAAQIPPTRGSIFGPNAGVPDQVGLNSNRVAVTSRVQRTLAGVPVLPGATALSSPPAPALRQLRVTDRQAIYRWGFWLAPGTVAQAIAFFAANPPAGLVLADGYGAANADGALRFVAAAPGRTGPTVAVFVVAFDGEVAVRVDVLDTWTSRQPIAHVDRVGIEIMRYLGDDVVAAPTVDRTVTGAGAQRLADVINGLPVAVDQGDSCPTTYPIFLDRLDFRLADGQRVVVVVHAGCARVRQKEPGGTSFVFLDGNMDAQIMATLGLPSNYGR